MADNKVTEAAGKTKGFFAEFKEFISRGSVMDMAVGVIIGGAFGAIVTSLVNDIIMPLISAITGGLDFSNWFVALDGNTYATLAKAQEAGAATLNFGSFLSNIINFIIIALCIFSVIKALNKMHDKFGAAKEEAAPTTKVCPFCKSEIAIDATRCPHCTSQLDQ
jgi:large conductance mechanosensitive channel